MRSAGLCLTVIVIISIPRGTASKTGENEMADEMCRGCVQTGRHSRRGSYVSQRSQKMQGWRVEKLWAARYIGA